MAVKTLKASVRHQAEAGIIDLFGEINSFAQEVLSSAYTEAVATDPGAIVVNFIGVDYINSAGIALLVGLLSQARKSNRRFLVYGLSDHYNEIFQITRLSDFMSIHPNEMSALHEVENVVHTQVVDIG